MAKTRTRENKRPLSKNKGGVHKNKSNKKNIHNKIIRTSLISQRKKTRTRVILLLVILLLLFSSIAVLSIVGLEHHFTIFSLGLPTEIENVFVFFLSLLIIIKIIYILLKI